MGDVSAAMAVLRMHCESAALTMLLTWGEAVNAIDTLPEGPEREAAKERARLAGSDAQLLAMGLAKRLRPREVRGG